MNNSRKFLIGSALIVCTLIVMSTTRSQFETIFLAFGCAFLLAIYVFKKTDGKKDLHFWIGLGVVLRFITLFFFPNLSDDIYRFIWDGNLLTQGFNPFDYVPSQMIESGTRILHNTSDLYQNLNSPDYHTIYPPVCQLLFAGSSISFAPDWYLQSLFLKTLIFAAELGSLRILYLLLEDSKLPLKNILLYAMNPLVIIEICGNLHFEGLMIFFLLGSYLLLKNKKWVGSGLLFGLSILSKLVPAILAPFLIRRLKISALIKFGISALLIVILGFLPLLNSDFISNFSGSLDLYFHTFEFNASIYYIFRWIGFQWKGFNMIAQFGSLMPVLFLIALTYIFFSEQRPDIKNFPKIIVLTFSLYFIFGTTVHPWYITTILAFSVLTQYRFPVIWSFLIFCTYINYSYPTYQENLWIVAVEYLVIIPFMLIEVLRYKRPAIARG